MIERRFYSAPLNTVAPAARQAVLAAGLNEDAVSQPDSLTWMIIAKKGMSCSPLDHILAAH